MIEIKKVLCPIDFSEISRHAYSYAAAIARWYQSEIVALHVVVNRPAVEAAPVPYVAVPPALSLEQVRADAMRALPEFLRAAHGGEVKFKVLVVEAPDVHREIVAQAGVIRPDLVVMGSHGRTGFDRIVLGSVAEKVLRKSAVPVLIVPPHAAGTPPPAAARFHRILCATDFSTGSLEALTFAMSLAQEADADLILLHVIEALPELYELSIGEHMNITAIRAAVEAQSRERLQTLVPETVRTSCAVDNRHIGRSSVGGDLAAGARSTDRSHRDGSARSRANRSPDLRVQHSRRDSGSHLPGPDRPRPDRTRLTEDDGVAAS